MADVSENLVLNGTKGAVGKEYVLRTRGKKTFRSKYPDMSNIVPSEKQTGRRYRFRMAMKYAQTINNDPGLKAAYSVHKEEQTVYHAAIQDYMRGNIPEAFAHIAKNLACEQEPGAAGTTIASPTHKPKSMDTTATPPPSHFNDIKATLVKIVKTLRPDDNDLPMIIESWGEKLNGAETLDALNIWLHGCLEEKKNDADQVEELKELDKLEPDPVPADTTDVSG